jgi:uncharacterized protein (TIGR01777 family)
MKVLLTGATGLVGQTVGTELVRRGHKVVALSRQTAEVVKSLVPFPCDVITWDGVSDLRSTLLQGVDAVVHLAGESVAGQRWTDEHKRKMWESRVDYTKMLVQQLRWNNIQLQAYVGATAIGFYGDRADEILNEDSSVGDGSLSELCVAWEKAHSEVQGCTPCLLRIGVVLSNRGGALAKMLPPFRWGVGGVLGSGNQWMSWIHLEDLTQMIVFAMEQRKTGLFNAIAPNPVTNREFTACMGEVLSVPTFAPAPEFALKALLGEMASVVLASQRVSAEKIVAAGFKFKYPDLKPVLQDTCDAAIQGSDEMVAFQWLNAPVSQVFEFFSSEKNLERITPPFLNFKVKGISTPEIQKGTLIDYTLSLHGIPFGWRTLIDVWEPNQRFVDTQLKGPYRQWHHTHAFESLGGGTLMADRVLYKLPLGFLGKAVAGFKVRNDVGTIFKYRREVISGIFPYK